MRETAVILGLVLLSSAAACLLGTRRRRLHVSHVPSALAFTLEALGLGAVFFAVNVGLGVAVGITTRAVGVAFLPLYLFGDWTLLVVSLVQGLAFRRLLAGR